ncbi:hypothetical protein [Leptothoe kymatousa]|nr:hypothetical protein [Leptothoe kymatousa]
MAVPSGCAQLIQPYFTRRLLRRLCPCPKNTSGRCMQRPDKD